MSDVIVFLVNLLLLVAVVPLYLLPTVVAVRRGKRNSLPIFIINLFLGWTSLAWVIALAWSLAHEAPR